jgi:hypothetical protein
VKVMQKVMRFVPESIAFLGSECCIVRVLLSEIEECFPC